MTAVTPDLNFSIVDAAPLKFAASPHIVFKLRVDNTAPVAIHTTILRCQVQLETARRRYETGEQERLTDLFGDVERWGETLRSLLWTNTSVVAPSFSESITVDLAVPCTFDFNVAATKYFAGLDSGTVAVSFFFNGTVFYAAEDGRLQVAPISWEKEASYKMPVQVWRELMDIYYPNSAWICLPRNTFDRVYAFKIEHGIPTLEGALEAMTR